jgi:hypothetical protein
VIGGCAAQAASTTDGQSAVTDPFDLLRWFDLPPVCLSGRHDVP